MCPIGMETKHEVGCCCSKEKLVQKSYWIDGCAHPFTKIAFHCIATWLSCINWEQHLLLKKIQTIAANEIFFVESSAQNFHHKMHDHRSKCDAFLIQRQIRDDLCTAVRTLALAFIEQIFRLQNGFIEFLHIQTKVNWKWTKTKRKLVRCKAT